MDRIGPKRVLRWYHREWREKLGLSQEAVAERMSTTKGTISKLENPGGKNGQKMNDKWVVEYCEAFGIEPADLMRDPDRPDLNQLLRGATDEDVAKATEIVAAFMRKAG